MGPIGTFSGLASGIQWRDMIDEIMAIDRARQVTPLTNGVAQRQKGVDAWGQVGSRFSKLTSAAVALRDGTAFDAFAVEVGTTESGRAVLTASAGESATPGTYTVEVVSLARAEKLASAVHASATDPLGLTGGFDGGGNPLPLTFTVNGATIEIEQDASLNQVRDAINQANTGADPTGVSATVLTTAAGEHRLILTAESTGTAGIRLEDGADGALAQLGVAVSSRSTLFSGAMDEAPPPLATVLGLSSPPEVRTIIIDGQEIQVDLSTDTLSSLLDKIRAAALAAGRDPDAAASIVEEIDGAETKHRLVVQGGVVGKWNDADTQAILDALGFTRENEIAAGSDAQFAIDGFAMTRRSNSVSDALEGVTINLQQAEAGSPVEVRVKRDVDATISAVQELVSAYNELVGYTSEVTAAGEPLAANTALKSAVSSFTRVFLTELEGTAEHPFLYERATLIGVSLSRTGRLEVDESKLRSALETNPEDVRRLFAGYEDGPQGLAGRIAELGEAVTRSGDGLIAGQTESLEAAIERLTQRADNAEARLEVRRESLIRQFTAMEEALSKLQAQSNWLASQLESLKPRERS